MSGAGLKMGLAVAELLLVRGETGVYYTEVCEIFGISDSDKNLGWLVGFLRSEGFLVQVEEAQLSILPEAPIRQGMWVRHLEHGLVKVFWARDGFPCVNVRKLHDARTPGTEFRVRREELSGR